MFVDIQANKPISQIPQCIGQISHKTPFMLQKCALTKRRIVGYGTGALWDLCNRSIWRRCNGTAQNLAQRYQLGYVGIDFELAMTPHILELSRTRTWVSWKGYENIISLFPWSFGRSLDKFENVHVPQPWTMTQFMKPYLMTWFYVIMKYIVFIRNQLQHGTCRLAQLRQSTREKTHNLSRHN